jgi:hypothetical protein
MRDSARRLTTIVTRHSLNSVRHRAIDQGSRARLKQAVLTSLGSNPPKLYCPAQLPVKATVFQVLYIGKRSASSRAQLLSKDDHST